MFLAYILAVSKYFTLNTLTLLKAFFLNESTLIPVTLFTMFYPMI